MNWGSIFAFAGVSALVCPAAAQSVAWKTNYYHVTGTNFAEIRRSLLKARPWKEDYDGYTTWTVKWRFATSRGESCELRDFTTSTSITTTLPFWTTPNQASSETRERWRNFYTRLSDHEMGHARLALAAGAEVQRSVTNGMRSEDCAALRATVNETAERVMQDYRQKEKEYDRATAHGRAR